MASVFQAVNEREKAAEQQPWLKEEGSRALGIILGSVIYALGVNLFLRPLHLYSGGFMGFAQLLTTVLREYAGLDKAVTVVGCNNHAELWDSAKWNEQHALEMTPENIAAVMEELEF